jgi:hypothetical protein
MVLYILIITFLYGRQEDKILNHIVAGVLQIYVLRMSSWMKFLLDGIILKYLNCAALSKDFIWWLMKFFLQ